MKLFNTTALAAILAASTAVAGSHSSGNSDTSSDMSNSDSSATMQSSDASGTDTAQTDDAMSSDSQNAELIRTRDITGGAIYTMNEANDEGWDGTMMYDEVSSDWNEIGEIEDIVLSRDGKMTGIVAEIGGFLDIGDKHVMLPVADVKLVPVDETGYVVVTRYNEEDLEELESVDESAWY